MTRRALSPEHRAAISAGLRAADLTKSLETRRRISEAKLGRPRDEATRAKISAALTGRKDPAHVRAKKQDLAMRGTTSPTWVGEAVSYNGAHNRARLSLPMTCAGMDGTCKGRLEVALRHDAPPELIRISRRGHSYFIGDASADGYYRLCISHHRRYDNAQRPNA